MANEFDKGIKHDFDLEVVLQAFQNCKRDDDALILDHYVTGYIELCRFFKLSGRLFGFVAKDLEEKIKILQQHRNSECGNAYETIQSMIDFEVKNEKTRITGYPPSGARTILRLHRALGFILTFMNKLSQSTDDTKASDIASEVYKSTLAQFHPWVVQKMAGLAMYMLPSRRQLIDTMCKHDYDKALSVLLDVVSAGMPIYNITQEALSDNDLLNLP